MAINKKLIHFKTKENFNREVANNNILESSICFIQDTKEIYTHGQLYNGSAFDPSNIEASIKNIITNYATKSDLDLKQDIISDLDIIRLGASLGRTSVQANQLATVAISGDYNDLSNKPTYSAVTGVKGNSETTYRTGNVNITKANIGLSNVDNTADAAKSVNYAASAGSVSKSLTVGSQTYNGSAAVTITAADLGLSSAFKYSARGISPNVPSVVTTIPIVA